MEKRVSAVFDPLLRYLKAPKSNLEHRVNYLINAFCKLDLERQQQLLAVAGALAHQE